MLSLRIAGDQTQDFMQAQQTLPTELHPQALASLLKYYLVVCSILHALWLAHDGTGTWF